MSYPDPRYVKSIDSKTNTITISRKEELYRETCLVSNLNWLIDIPEFPLEVYSQIRYNSKKVLSKILFKDDNFKIQFNEAQLAVTPGQSIVFYINDILIGGGIIEL